MLVPINVFFVCFVSYLPHLIYGLCVLAVVTLAFPVGTNIILYVSSWDFTTGISPHCDEKPLLPNYKLSRN